LIGWKETVDSTDNKCYVLKFLPDISKILWIEELENIPEEKEKEKSPVTEADEKQIEEKKEKVKLQKKKTLTELTFLALAKDLDKNNKNDANGDKSSNKKTN